MWEKVKSYLVVVVITVLIWLVADQNVRVEELFRIPVSVSSRNPDRFVTFDGTSKQKTLHVVMSGRRRHLSDFRKLVRTTDVFEAVVDNNSTPSSRPQSVSAENDILKRIEAVSQSQLTIKDVVPPSFSIIIDKFVTLTDVIVEPDFGDLKVNAGCSPKTVSVRLPAFAAAQLLADPVIRPNAAGIVQQATRAEPNAPEFRVSLPLALNMATAVPVEFDPDKVTVTGVVEALQATAIKGPVQITFSIPNEVQERFSIEVSPGTNLRQGIEVTGPTDLLGQLDPHEIRAFVDVMAADMDKPGKEITRQVDYFLPPGFTLASDAPPHEIIFKLVPRPVAAPAGN